MDDGPTGDREKGKSMITVLVVDDDFRVARIHSAFVDRIEGFRTIGVANTGQEAIRLAVALVPDLILLDLYLPDVFGLDVLNRMRVAGVEGDAIVISAANESETVERAVKLGVVELPAQAVHRRRPAAATHPVPGEPHGAAPEDAVRPGGRRPALGPRRGWPVGVAAQGTESGDGRADRAGADGRPRASCRPRSARTPSASPGSARVATWSTSPGRARSVVSLRYGTWSAAPSAGTASPRPRLRRRRDRSAQR